MEILPRWFKWIQGENKSIVNTQNVRDSHQKYYENVEKWELMNRNVIDDEARARQLCAYK